MSEKPLDGTELSMLAFLAEALVWSPGHFDRFVKTVRDEASPYPGSAFSKVLKAIEAEFRLEFGGKPVEDVEAALKRIVEKLPLSVKSCFWRRANDRFRGVANRLTTEVKQPDHKPIWVLTVMMFKPGRLPDLSPIEHQRTWGWFPDKETAVRAVKENDGDMYECAYYNMAVIEEIQWGSMATADSETWFSVKPIKSDKPLGEYLVTEIEKPEELAHMCGWGMG